MRFTAERREMFLVLLAAGGSLQSACATVGVSRQAVHAWTARGRAGVNPVAAEFARRLDAIRGAGNGRVADDEIEATLERGTRRGSVTAARALVALRRRREESKLAPEVEALPPDHPYRFTTPDDPILALHPMLLSRLTPEQRAEVRAIHADADPGGEAVLDCCMDEAERISRARARGVELVPGSNRTARGRRQQERQRRAVG